MTIHLPDYPTRGTGSKSVPVVQAIPYRDGPWQSSELTSWGGTLQSPPGVFGLGAPGAVVGVFENQKSFGPPKAYTLNLSVLNTGDAAVVNPGIIRAIIMLGAGAGREIFEVDWRNGVSVGLSGGIVTVQARQDGAMAHSVMLGATLAEGSALARSTPPTWSTLRQALLPGTTVRVAIPRRARTVRIVDSVGALSQVEVQALQVAGALFVVQDVWMLPAEQLLRTGVALPTTATHLDITAGAVLASTFTAEFGLDC